MSILIALKKTIAMFLSTNPDVYMIFQANANINIRTVADFDTFSNSQLQEWFPAKTMNGKANLHMFMASSMPIN
jgi:hypothetical protein